MPATSTGRWTLSTSVSKVDASPTVTLSLRANAVISSWPSPGFVPTLTVACQGKEREIHAYVTAGTAAAVEDAGRQGTVKMWLDEDPPLAGVLARATDGRALVFANGKEFVYAVLPHKRLLFRFTPVNSTHQETTFDLRGFERALQPLGKACQWDFRGEAARRAESAAKLAKEEAERMAFLVDKLRSPDAGDRAIAAGMIGKSGAAALAAVPALIVALREDRDSAVRAKVAETCRLLGRVAKSAVPTLREAAINDESDLVRNEARQAIAVLERIPEP
jgi:hypothetical protein